MRRYRTEIVIPPDRTLLLQIPPGLPVGPAVVIVEVDDPAGADERREAGGEDLDRQDIEWWEEFDEDEAPPDVAVEGAGSGPRAER